MLAAVLAPVLAQQHRAAGFEFLRERVTALPALATRSPWASASFVALSISAALSPTETMKCDVEAAFSLIPLVVSFCSATAPLTFSNTGRIASIATAIRCTASTEPAASFCSASIFLVISSVACWVCTASALTSVATTAKPRPAAPARAASMVELSASSVVCLAICAIRLTTLPMAAEDFAQPVDIGAGFAGGGGGLIGELAASRTWEPMPSAERVNLSAACENVVAVDCAALVRPVRASVRWRMVESVVAVASAPPATERAARSSWRIIPPISSSSSSRISFAELRSDVRGHRPQPQAARAAA